MNVGETRGLSSEGKECSPDVKTPRALQDLELSMRLKMGTFFITTICLIL